MAIIIDMISGEVLQDNATPQEQKHAISYDRDRPEMIQPGLATYDREITRTPEIMPEELVNVDIDAFLNDMGA